MKIKAIAALSTALLLAAGCGSTSSGDAGKTQVIASSYPFAFVAEQVGGTNVAVENLTSPGVEPHDLELKPRQVGAVQNADLVIFERKFQASVDQAVDQADRPDTGTIDIAGLIDMKPIQAGAEGAHGHGGMDPHVWLDPTNMSILTDAVADRLSTLDPEHAGDYRANADKLRAALTDLDERFRAGLADCRIKTIVTSHAAFQYLTDRYGLTQVPIAGIDPSNEPSPAQLADIAKLVQRDKITTIFTEELVSPAIADTVAKTTGVRTATLDPIEGLSDDTAHEDYLTLMTKNLATLKKACA